MNSQDCPATCLSSWIEFPEESQQHTGDSSARETIGLQGAQYSNMIPLVQHEMKKSFQTWAQMGREELLALIDFMWTMAKNPSQPL